MRILRLTLKKKWFDMIASGEKKEEYREVKEFYVPRFLEVLNSLDLPKFSIYYRKLNEIFWFSAGWKRNRHEGLDYLIESGILKYKEYDLVEFKNGYAKDAPTLTVEFKGIEHGIAKPKWSDNWQGRVFILKLGKVTSPLQAKESVNELV